MSSEFKFLQIQSQPDTFRDAQRPDGFLWFTGYTNRIQIQEQRGCRNSWGPSWHRAPIPRAPGQPHISRHTGQCWGQNTLTFIPFGPNSTKWHVLGCGGSPRLALGRMLWFRGQALTDAQRQLHMHQASLPTDHCSPTGPSHEAESWALAELGTPYLGCSRDHVLGKKAHGRAGVCPCRLKVSLNTLRPLEGWTVQPHGGEWSWTLMESPPSHLTRASPLAREAGSEV